MRAFERLDLLTCLLTFTTVWRHLFHLDVFHRVSSLVLRLRGVPVDVT